MSHIEVAHVELTLPDGRVLLDDVSFRVGDGAVAALVGANGAGKTTLMRLIAGDIEADSGSITRTGSMAVMRQFVGKAAESGGVAGTVHDLLVAVSAAPIRAASAAMDAAELAMMEAEDEPTQMRYAQAISDWSDVGGYEAEVLWDVACTAALGLPFESVRWRDVATLSGGEQKRLVLELLLRGSDDLLLLDEPDNYLDVPTKRWLEEQLRETNKTVLLVSHDRELLARAATVIITLELGAAGSTAWSFGGGFGDYHRARRDRFARFEELRRRWDEDHAKLKALVQMYKTKAKYNDGLASRYQAAVTRLRMFEQAGPPESIPREQSVTMRLAGGRTGRRVIMCDAVSLTGLTEPFDLEVWFGERVALLGANGSGKSHLLRLLARGGTDPDLEHRPVEDLDIPAVAHTGSARLGARVRPGWFAQTHAHPELVGRSLIDILHRGDPHRSGMPREQASRVLDRYELSQAALQPFEQLSGGQQARFQILLLELSGATLLLLDEPTDNLDLESADALQEALEAFEGTVLAITHDRWFAAGFDRYLHLGSDGRIRETQEPVWDDGRLAPKDRGASAR